MSTVRAQQQQTRPGIDAVGLRWLAAACGVVAALVTLAVSEAVALFVSPSSSPLFAVGGWIIDLAPAGFKEWIIHTVGTADKPVLLISLGVLVLLLALLVGLLELRWAPWGSVLLAGVSAVAAIAVMTRAGASVSWLLPTVLGAVAGVLVLRASVARLRRWRASSAASHRIPSNAQRLDRRSFLVFTLTSAAVAIAVGTSARIVNAGSVAVTAARQALRLPKAATPAAPVPAGADLRLSDLSSYVTPNDTFYRIDTALQVPAIDANAWKLTVTGAVDNPFEISFDELLALPLTEHMLTLACVSNEVGGDLIGNALWLGYPIRELLKRAGPHSGMDMVLSTSQDGWSAGTPLDVLLDDNTEALLAVGMNGEPLPLEHGFPVRMVVPGLYGYVSATKWVTQLKVTRFADEIGYWTDKGWSARGPVKTESRIDKPRNGASVKAGQSVIAGVAWAQHTGIEKVEVRVDGGQWQQAKLAETVSIDTWRQWVLPWQATSGNHTIQVRATDASGYTQTSREAPPAPDGASGWHAVQVIVS